MKQTSILVLATLALASCGKVEKRPSPFATISNEQKTPDSPEKKEAEFRVICEKRGGSLLPHKALKPTEKMCMFTTSRFSRNLEQIEGDFKDGRASKVYLDLGRAQLAHYVMLEVLPKNSGKVMVYSGNILIGEAVEGRMPLTEVPIGDIQIVAFKGNYQKIDAYKVKCYTRDRAWIHCN